MNVTTWRAEFAAILRVNGDTSDFVAVSPDASILDVAFNSDYGSVEGPAVLIWTERFVYFPICYDGAEYLGFAPRNPQSEAQGHQGGG